jgi:hypothetical protein
MTAMSAYRWAWFSLAVVALALVVAGALYKAGPKSKTVTYMATVQPTAPCIRWADSLNPNALPGTGMVCVERGTRPAARAEQMWRDERTNAWERISGALTG